jgi:hypothetical protein
MTKEEAIFKDDFQLQLEVFLKRTSNFGQGLENAECSSNFNEIQYEPHPLEIEILPKEFTFSIKIYLNIIKNNQGFTSINDYYKIQIDNINGNFYENHFHYNFSNSKISNRGKC